jgi:hypothetical protein
MGRYNLKDDFRFENTHEKLGIGATKSWVCFGDSNHRISEITHAGLHVSILWKLLTIFNWVGKGVLL